MTTEQPKKPRKKREKKPTVETPVAIGLGSYQGEPPQPESQPERDNSANEPLTHKQQLFVEFYLKHLSGTQAAIDAGYTPANARQHASRLMTKANISAAIERRMAERIAIIGADHTLVLTRLVAELKADVADLFNDNGSFKPVEEWPLVWRQGLVAGVEVYEEFDTVQEGNKRRKVLIGQTQKVKFSDRTRRLELFGKHTLIRAFSDRKPETEKANLTATGILADLKPTAVGPKVEDGEE